MGTQKESVFYDNVYASSEKYAKKWNEIPMYYSVWRDSISILQKNKSKSLLDIGCGCGHFGEACKELAVINYKGIDFSEVAISKCREKLPEFEFECMDVFDYHYNDEVDTYVSHEFLEHVNTDLDLFDKLLSGKLFVFSVPNFDSAGHVRWFVSEEEVRARYTRFFKGNTLKIEKTILGQSVIYLGYGVLL